MYGKLSKSYDQLHGSEQMRKLLVIKSELEPKPGDTVLDVGCGTGLSSVLGCKVVGIDSSHEMVLKARKRITAVQGNAENLPFPDNSFDTVICVTAMHNFESIESALMELSRVSRSNVVVSSLKKSSKAPIIQEMVENAFNVYKIADDIADRVFFCKVR
ncbi:class I SAM-dependent methyltransferase [Candidatus Woesearchaeota archaeon]|nr:class I SAM-dependent methyltransferase [Candidatus Woesearchaeota archaeon]